MHACPICLLLLQFMTKHIKIVTHYIHYLDATIWTENDQHCENIHIKGTRVVPPQHLVVNLQQLGVIKKN